MLRRVLAAGLLPAIVGLSGTDLPGKFDVTSVKACSARDERFAYRRLPGGGLYATGVTLKILLVEAYGLQPFQIAGGPAWIDDDCWTIDAKVEGVQGQLSIAQQAPMLQALIEERYKLQARRETMEMPAFALVAAKGGAKLARHTTGDSDTQLRALPGSWTFRNVDIASLAPRLSRAVGRTVIDRTGLAGRYDLTLEFVPEYTSGDSGNRASIFTALQEQLGLKLESIKGPVEVLTIDHVEKPSAN